MTRACARWFPALFLLLIATGCATAPTGPPALSPPAAELAQYLVDPTIGATEVSQGVLASREAHSRLLRTGEAPAIRREMESLLAAQPDLAPARVVLAQALLVSGDAEAAAAEARLASVAAGLARELILGRALEAANRTAEAAIVFARAAAVSPVARSAAERLGPEAAAVLASKVADATAKRRFPEAERSLADLTLLQPKARRTQELRLELASATGNRELELELLRLLGADAGAPKVLRLRRADLELAMGDAAAGLAIVQQLAAAAPGDAEIADHLRRAQFRWRVVNSPEAVRRAASLAQVSRADGAVLLYWCLPQVRTGKGGEARIASDVLDHPAREEIVRVANLGLLSVDETLHTFGPDRPLRRSDLLTALLRVLARAPASGPCAAGGDASGLCERAASCGLVPTAGDCLAGGGVSGAEALEMIRRATERLELP
jgi:hypothetical protein